MKEIGEKIMDYNYKSIEEFNKEQGYGSTEDLLIVKQLKESFNDYDVLEILNIISNICYHCYDSSRDCQCMNDN